MTRFYLISLLAGLAMLAPFVATAKDYYPDRALEVEVNGVANIDCVLQADGKVKDCVVVKETPAGYGFGEATIRLFEDQFDLNQQKAADKSHKPGDHMTFTYRWELH
ncbi:energy transducer TonB [Asticcacaulis sp.]|uniref:energy transducer TonB n=1 Tax=Asticcacaulis sp. TaxID=1872648 RepID=UPI003F7BC8A6